MQSSDSSLDLPPDSIDKLSAILDACTTFPAAVATPAIFQPTQPRSGSGYNSDEESPAANDEDVSNVPTKTVVDASFDRLASLLHPLEDIQKTELSQPVGQSEQTPSSIFADDRMLDTLETVIRWCAVEMEDAHKEGRGWCRFQISETVHGGPQFDRKALTRAVLDVLRRRRPPLVLRELPNHCIYIQWRETPDESQQQAPVPAPAPALASSSVESDAVSRLVASITGAGNTSPGTGTGTTTSRKQRKSLMSVLEQFFSMMRSQEDRKHQMDHEQMHHPSTADALDMPLAPLDPEPPRVAPIAVQTVRISDSTPVLPNVPHPNAYVPLAAVVPAPTPQAPSVQYPSFGQQQQQQYAPFPQASGPLASPAFYMQHPSMPPNYSPYWGQGPLMGGAYVPPMVPTQQQASTSAQPTQQPQQAAFTFAGWQPQPQFQQAPAVVPTYQEYIAFINGLQYQRQNALPSGPAQPASQ